MSSPGSAPSSSAITRSHTPADPDVKSEDEEGDEQEHEEDELPEKLKHLLAQSTIYSQIIAEKLQRETEERRRKEGRAEKRRANKEKRAHDRSSTAKRQTRTTTTTSNKPSSTPASSRTNGHANGSATPSRTRRRDESMLSEQEDSDEEDEGAVKQHDFAQDGVKAGKPPSSTATRSSSRRGGGAPAAASSSPSKGKAAAARTTTRKGASTRNGKTRREKGQDREESDSEDEDDDQKAEGRARVANDASDSDSSEDDDDDDDEDPDAEARGNIAGDDSKGMQPRLVTGATMKSYQIAGMEWLISLYENGLNGILADEMGLGKTLQTIAFLAYLRDKGVWGPFLVCCPLSTLANWVNEFERFTPDIPVVLYHGTPQERAEIRAERLAPPTNEKLKNVKNRKGSSQKSKGSNTTDTFPIVVTSYELVINDRRYLSSYNWKFLIVDESHRLKNLNCKLIRELMSYKSANRLLLTGTPLQNNLEELWSLLNFLMPEIFDDLDSFKSWFNIDVSLESNATTQIVTKLHAILKPFLLRRIKRDVEKGLPPKKEYLLSAPLTVQQKKLYDAVVKRQIRDFLLKKKDVLPDSDKVAFSSDDETIPKKPTTNKKGGVSTSSKKRKSEAAASAAGSNKRARPSYAEVEDEEFLDSLDDGSAREAAEAFESKRWSHIYASGNGENGDEEEDVEAKNAKNAAKKISQLKLSNMVMQLRKVVNHPWLFDWPMDPKTGEYTLDERVVTSSGKMMLLDRLLTRLFATGHKVLVFSQFTTQLDIIEDWAVEWKGWKICRIDGLTKQDDRRQQLKDFNEKTGPKSPHLFLLSTRAGGVGINLTGADTVILFDSDWNPQMDLQAMDRAHRLGQKKPVLVFRLVTANTIEAKMLERAGAKRKLEALVIGSGKYTTSLEDLQDIFTGNTSRKSDSKKKMIKGSDAGTGQQQLDKAAGLAAQMFAEEMREQADGKKEVRVVQDGEEVISDSQLDMLLDRSDEAMGRGKGWKVEEGGDESSKAIEVIETVAAGDGDQEEDMLADLFHGEESAPASPKTDETDED